MKPWFGAAGAMTLFCSSNLFAVGYSVGLGAEYSEGDYGTGSDTSYWYVPLNLGYRSGRLLLGLTIPYISMSGSADTATVGPGGSGPTMPMLSGAVGAGSGGGTSGTSGTPTHSESTESGLGDVTFSAGWQLLAESELSPWLDIGAKVKFGTADADRNLGSGENDYAVQLGAGKAWFSGYLGYMWLGDTDLVDYNDIVYGGVGANFPLGEWKGGVDYYTEQQSIDGVDPASEATVSLGRSLDSNKWLRLYLIKGFSDSSPEWGAGVTLSRYF